ncbi:DoxX family membrane protein [Leptospira sp. 96542]|nr:DoxX family membrane protein [Leptospira sp. 96542]
MKIAYTIVRVLMGALFVFSSAAYFFQLIPTPELTGNMKEFNEGLTASGYFMTLLKGTEFVCGIAFIVGRLVPLASIVIAPVVINIFFVHVFLAPEGLPIAIFLVVASGFVAYYNRNIYKPLFDVK